MALGADHILDSDHREAQPIRLTVFSRGSGASAALAATDHVRADDEEAVGIEHLARPNGFIPPARFFRRVFRIVAGHMGVPTERMADQDGVGAFGIELAVGFVSQRKTGQDAAPA